MQIMQIIQMKVQKMIITQQIKKGDVPLIPNFRDNGDGPFYNFGDASKNGILLKIRYIN